MKKREACKWMKVNLSEFVDSKTLEVNCTRLAEECCNVFKCNDIGGPLDDPDHWIWDESAGIGIDFETKNHNETWDELGNYLKG